MTEDEEADARIAKRRKAHPRTVALLLCPSCGQYGVPESERFPFCLKCQWRAAMPKETTE
jgi:hypothetical protein